ncbi:hypothetical protein [Roseobacter sp. S98]|uniref:hypothetical protein n=1 Tax=Roseobacter algicola (ex Choi et al. 2025) (nom. illeg.) TaxID=3092138 RepID=UPI0035C76F7A
MNADASEPTQMSKESTLALTTLLHHHWVTSYRASSISQKELAEEFDITPNALNNFMRQGAPGKSDEGSALERIRDRLYKIYIEERGINDAPDYIRRACAEAFPDEPDLARLLRGDVGVIFAEWGSATTDDIWAKVDEVYAGCYDVFRYAARVLPGSEPEEKKDENNNTYFVSMAIQAAMQIFPREKNQLFPRFELHYNPEPVEDGFPPRKSSGSVVVVNRHMYLIGKEEVFSSPLFMACKFNPVSSLEFTGLVTRHHDGGGEVFSSRVLFRRNDAVKNIEELSERLGVLSEEALPDEIKPKRRRFLNATDYKGKGALILI